MQSIVTHLRAPNDANGNPRRLWMVTTTEGLSFCFDEGYIGRDAYRRTFPDAIEGPSFNISASEYRSILRNA